MLWLSLTNSLHLLRWRDPFPLSCSFSQLCSLGLPVQLVKLFYWTIFLSILAESSITFSEIICCWITGLYQFPEAPTNHQSWWKGSKGACLKKHVRSIGLAPSTVTAKCWRGSAALCCLFAESLIAWAIVSHYMCDHLRNASGMKGGCVCKEILSWMFRWGECCCCLSNHNSQVWGLLLQ